MMSSMRQPSVAEWSAESPGCSAVAASLINGVLRVRRNLVPIGSLRRWNRAGLWLLVRFARGYNSTMKFRMLLEYAAQAGRWSAVFPDLPGCASAGDTEAEAAANAKKALALWFDSTPVDIPKNGKLLEVALP